MGRVMHEKRFSIGRYVFLSEKTIGEEDSLLQMTIRLARVLSSTGPFTPFERLRTPLSTNDLRLTGA
jgi:hypothetical protein